MSKNEQKFTLEDLPTLWDVYAQAGYEKLYQMNCFQQIRKALHDLFLPAPCGLVLDAGCGTGTMFATITSQMKPAKVVAVDFSSGMLKKAEGVARKLRPATQVVFKFQKIDLTQEFPWQDNSFDAELFGLVICFLPSSNWKHALREAYRTTKPKGHLYISTFIQGWDFSKMIRKHTPSEFLASPIGCLHGLRLRKYPAKITEVAKVYGMTYPEKGELIDLLVQLGAKNITVKEIFWGAGIALRFQKS